MEKALNVDIRQFYREDLGVHSEELLDKLEAVSQAVTLQKGEILNKKGERQTMLPFLIEGMMRCVTLDSEGKEKTVGFTMSRGDVVLSNMDLTGCHISTDQAMVPSTLILLPIDYVLQNMKDEPEVIRVYQEQIIKWGMIYQSRAVSLSQGDATERFEWFCKEAFVDAADGHTAVLACSGMKKSICGFMPLIVSLAQAGENLIVTDPKGELYDRTAGLLQHRGYQVYCLNFRSMDKDCFNILSYAAEETEDSES